MSPVECAAWVVGTWLAIAIVAAWIKHRLQQRNRKARVQQLRPVPAAADNAEGINRGDWDDCELILAATNDIEAGLQRLRDALRKEET